MSNVTDRKSVRFNFNPIQVRRAIERLLKGDEEQIFKLGLLLGIIKLEDQGKTPAP